MKYWIDEETGIRMCEPDCADEWCQFIWEIGVDYDGCNTVESLKMLVDELVDMAMKARQCIKNNKIS